MLLNKRVARIVEILSISFSWAAMGLLARLQSYITIYCKTSQMWHGLMSTTTVTVASVALLWGLTSYFHAVKQRFVIFHLMYEGVLYFSIY